MNAEKLNALSETACIYVKPLTNILYIRLQGYKVIFLVNNPTYTKKAMWSYTYDILSKIR